jgi:hypothetical protein
VLCNWFAPKLMNSPHISYAQHPEVSAEAELSALCAVYSIVIKSSQAKENAAGVTSTNGDDPMKGSKNDRATQQYTR